MSTTVGVYIGRFQPFHNGHKSVVDRMLVENDDAIVVFGGSLGPRSRDNPFSTTERMSMVDLAWDDDRDFIMLDHPNNPDDGVWAETLKKKIALFNKTVRLYGAYSDESSFYLDMFPEWENRTTKLEGYHVHATTIRLWLRNRDWIHIKQNVPPGTFEYLKKLVEEEPDTCHRWLRWSDERFG